MKRSFVRTVSSPRVNYIAILQRRVNANKAKGWEGFPNGLFLVGSRFAETEPAEIRPEQAADTEQGAACRIAVIGKAKQAG